MHEPPECFTAFSMRWTLVTFHQASGGNVHIQLHVAGPVVVAHVIVELAYQRVEIKCPEVYGHLVLLKSHHGVEVVDQFGQAVDVFACA